MENETTEVVVPSTTNETLAQVAIKEVVKAVIGLAVTAIGCALISKVRNRNKPTPVVIVEPDTTDTK